MIKNSSLCFHQSAAIEYKEENITQWKFVTVEVHGPFLGKIFLRCPLTLFTDIIFYPVALDLPYDNDTHEQGQKDCSQYLFICNSKERLEDDCPVEVRFNI